MQELLTEIYTSFKEKISSPFSRYKKLHFNFIILSILTYFILIFLVTYFNNLGLQNGNNILNGIMFGFGAVIIPLYLNLFKSHIKLNGYGLFISILLLLAVDFSPLMKLSIISGYAFLIIIVIILLIHLYYGIPYFYYLFLRYILGRDINDNYGNIFLKASYILILVCFGFLILLTINNFTSIQNAYNIYINLQGTLFLGIFLGCLGNLLYEFYNKKLGPTL